jgi:hypothetical protein
MRSYRLIKCLWVVVAGIVMMACKTPDGQAPNSGSSSNLERANTQATKKEASPFHPTDSGLGDLKNVAKRLNEVDAFQMKADSIGDEPTHMELEFVSPDRYHMKRPEYEAIIIGRDMYLNHNGTWRKNQRQIDRPIGAGRDFLNEEVIKQISEVKLENDETVNGQEAFVYRIRGATPESTATYQSKVWVGKGTGLPIKIESEFSDGPVTKMTAAYAYSPDVPIETPEP